MVFDIFENNAVQRTEEAAETPILEFSTYTSET